MQHRICYAQPSGDVQQVEQRTEHFLKIFTVSTPQYQPLSDTDQALIIKHCWWWVTILRMQIFPRLHLLPLPGAESARSNQESVGGDHNNVQWESRVHIINFFCIFWLILHNNILTFAICFARNFFGQLIFYAKFTSDIKVMFHRLFKIQKLFISEICRCFTRDQIKAAILLS